MPAAVGPVCAQPAATSAWDHLPQTVADVLFNRLDARSAAAARLVCAGWGRQLTGVRARLRPSSARLPRGWSTRLPAVRRLDLRDCPPEGRHGRSTVRLDAALEVAAGLTELALPSAVRGPELRGLLTAAPALTSLTLAGADDLGNEDLAVVARACPRLIRLDLTGCKRLTSDSAAPALARLRALQTLSLARCTRLSDTVLGNLRACSALSELSLARCALLTDDGLSALAAARSARLTALDLSGCDRLTGHGVSRLAALPSLERLSLAWCANVADLRGLRDAGGWPNLKSVDLSGCVKLSDASLAAAIAGPGQRLQSLRLSGCERLTDNGLADLVAVLTGKVVPRSMSVDSLACPRKTCRTTSSDDYDPIVYSDDDDSSDDDCFDDNGLSTTSTSSSSPSLTSLHLCSCKLITDAGLRSLAPLACSLQHLNAGNLRRLTHVGVAALASLSRLDTLSLSRCEKLGDDAADELLAMAPSLTSLDFSSCELLTDAAAVTLAELPHLVILNLGRCQRLTDIGLVMLSQAPSLRTLAVSGCRAVSDRGVASLAGLISLRSLDLSYCDRVTDSGIAKLAPLQQLTELNLSRCRLTDVGLAALAPLAALASLKLVGCDRVSAAALARTPAATATAVSKA
eukprot:jgi/Tetstr1/428154/TSEL_018205.t1